MKYLNIKGDEKERKKEMEKKEIDWKYKAMEKLGFGEESKKGGCERNIG